MSITLYRAKLNTANKTPEQVKERYDDVEPSEIEIQNYIKACNIIDGAEVLVMKSWTGKGYSLASWTPDDEDKFKEFIYQIEQDPVYGTYNEEREEFDKDWKTGDYSPAGSIVFDEQDVVIIEELKKNLEVIEEKGLQDVRVFQLCESDAVAAYSQDEAREWYKELTGFSDDDLYPYEDVQIVSPDCQVRKGEDEPGLITVREIVETYWDGAPFIAITSN